MTNYHSLLAYQDFHVFLQLVLAEPSLDFYHSLSQSVEVKVLLASAEPPIHPLDFLSRVYKDIELEETRLRQSVTLRREMQHSIIIKSFYLFFPVREPSLGRDRIGILRLGLSLTGGLAVKIGLRAPPFLSSLGLEGNAMKEAAAKSPLKG